MSRRWTALGTAVLASCAVAPQAELAHQSAETASYATELHPILEARCATLDCHGDPGRPLRLYADTGLRARDDLRDAPMTDDELAANVAALFGVDPFAESAAEQLVLLEPLAVSAGGVHHEGDDIWSSREDPGYRCVASFLEGEVDRAACADARARDALPPAP